MSDDEKKRSRDEEPTRTDPVCGMTVDPEDAAGSYEYRGTTYYFCSDSCRETFRDDPEAALRKKTDRRDADESDGNAPADRETGTYTCPMHPEVEQSGPGSCPKCGMDLEPKGGDTGKDETEGDSPELKAMSRRFWVSLVLTLPVFIIAM
jgi:Cu+-exporting ATPase